MSEVRVRAALASRLIPSPVRDELALVRGERPVLVSRRAIDLLRVASALCCR